MTNLENKDSVSVESENVTADVAEKFTGENVEKAMKEGEGSPFGPEFKNLGDGKDLPKVDRITDSDIDNWIKMVESRSGKAEIEAGFNKFLGFPGSLTEKGKFLFNHLEQQSNICKTYSHLVKRVNELSDKGEQFSDKQKTLLFELNLLMTEGYLMSHIQANNLKNFININKPLNADTKQKLLEAEDIITNNIKVVVRKMDKIAEEFAKEYFEKYGTSINRGKNANGEWKNANGEWKNANDEWKNANGGWKNANSEWKKENNDRKKSN